MLKKAFLLLLLTPVVGSSFAQTTFLPLRSEGHYLLDRLETLSGRLCDSLAMGDKPESRRNAVNYLESVKAQNDPAKLQAVNGGTPAVSILSDIDRYNMTQMISENGEWAPNENETINSKRPILKAFYKKQYNFLYLKTEDFLLDKNFFIIINPVTNNTVLMQNNNPQPAGISRNVFFSSRGAEVRGWISKKVGFYTSLTDNQEQFPYFVTNRTTGVKGYRQAVPGGDYFLKPKTINGAYDYMQVQAYINFDAVKNHVNVTFGTGKHFIGDGISSLFLTDNSSNMPYLQVQARIWKLNYESLYMELTPQYDNNLGDRVFWSKYTTMHYLTWNATRWLNIGFFEAEVFNRPNSYEIGYLNPIIFSTAINRFNGSGDKSLLGFSGKAIVARHLQFYGQFMLNEFRYKEILAGNGWYGNKFGVQVGGKYFDAFSIKNLDLQGELDAVRPYTYAAQDTFTNYSNYNQPLADPLGSGFVKAIGVIRYQPAKNLYLTLKATYYMHGVDTGEKNFGNTIYKNYTTAAATYGVKMINGPKSTCQILSFNASYQIRRNLFIDAGAIYRNYNNEQGIYPGYSTNGTSYGPLTTNCVYLGLRINAARREYDFF